MPIIHSDFKSNFSDPLFKSFFLIRREPCFTLYQADTKSTGLDFGQYKESYKNSYPEFKQLAKNFSDPDYIAGLEEKVQSEGSAVVAMTLLGNAYYFEFATPANATDNVEHERSLYLTAAQDLYTKAADKGGMLAKHYLSCILFYGSDRDRRNAIKLIASAKDYIPQAAFNAAFAPFISDPSLINFLPLYELAKNKNPDAMFLMCLSGDYLKEVESLYEPHEWLWKAHLARSPIATYMLTALRDKLAQGSIAQIDRPWLDLTIPQNWYVDHIKEQYADRKTLLEPLPNFPSFGKYKVEDTSKPLMTTLTNPLYTDDDYRLTILRFFLRDILTNRL